MFNKLPSFIRRLLGRRKSVVESNCGLLWKPSAISAELRSDNVHLKIGKYIQLEQKLNEDEYGWAQSKFDIPNTWQVQQVSVIGEVVEIVVNVHGVYHITKDNFGKLTFDILNGGHKDDETLHGIWQRHARVS